MSKTFIISYDLGIPEDSSDYELIINYIKSIGSWAKPLLSVWFVTSSSKTCKSIRDDLQGLTDSNDKILVMEVSGDDWATARLNEKVTSWMKENI